MIFKTPILLIVFNRPKQTKELFSVIKKLKPAKLFIAADGPRKNDRFDIQNCKNVQEIVSKINWKCEVKTLFRKENLGCGKGVSSAISWFFDQVDSGIILEDDVVPDLSFFPFCEELLKKYKDNTRIMAITGRNVAGKWDTLNEESYFFTSTLNVWGWATWKRAWKEFDYDLKDWPKFKKNSSFMKDFPPSFKKKVFSAYNKMYNHQLDTWDYQWDFAIRKNQGLTLVPSVNLVKNTGFGMDATHTKIEDKNAQNLSVFRINFPLIHSNDFLDDIKYFNYFINLNKPSLLKYLVNSLQILLKDPNVFFKLLKEKL